jgi:hypothetical protein
MAFHNTAQKHFEKLRKNFERLKRESLDTANLADFFKEAWHLVEITQKDPSISKDQKRQVGSFHRESDFKLCRAICNKEKHHVPKRGEMNVESSAKSGWGVGRFGMGAYGVGEPQIVVKSDQGDKIDALDLAKRIFEKWNEIFAPAST